MKILLFANEYLKKLKILCLKYFTLALIGWIIGIIVPYLGGKYIDILVKVDDKSDIYFYTKIILLFGVTGCIVSYFKGITFESLNRRAGNKLNLHLIDHIKKLPLDFFRRNNSVYIIDRINTDSSQIIDFAINESVNLLINICTSIFVVLVMGRINLKITLMMIFIIPIYLIMYMIFKKKMYEVRLNFIENGNEFTACMNQQLNRALYIKLNSLYDYMQRKMINRFEDFFIHIMRFMRVASLYGNINSMIESLASVVLFLYGGIEVFKGNLTVGEFTIINVYFNMLFASVQYFARFGGIYQRTLVSYNRVIEVLNIDKEENGSIEIEGIEDIELKDISFSYDQNQTVLNNFYGRFIKGNIYCIKGFNGSGKSTLIKIMLGIEQNYIGQVKFKGTDIKKLDMYKLRERVIGITEQEPTLLNDTLRNNINCMNIDEDEKRLIDNINKLDLGELIDSLPKGLDTVIDENNSNISGGEKQKISLLRILMKDPEIIILDEPSSALDQKSIRLLKDILMKLKEDKIIIMVSHDENLLEFADEIVEIDKGVRIYE